MFKTINNFPNYRISKYGVICRIPHLVEKITKNGTSYFLNLHPKIILPFDNGTGYLQVNLNVNKIRTKQYVHVLVAKTFLSYQGDTFEVDHINENKKNNHYTNLCWVTRKFNMDKMLNSNPHVLQNLI